VNLTAANISGTTQHQIIACNMLHKLYCI